MQLRAHHNKIVMPGLVPGIHVFFLAELQVVDGRAKPGHDDGEGLA
ncbi:ABC transporter [Bradyrhizobium sp.]|nr:ABC transporter [Bradyrhizobium sp.]MBI5318013.1 ABC transporter [Bradyrhizobium sp.]